MPCCRPARPVLRRARPRDAAIQQPHPSRLLRTSEKGGKAGTARVDASTGSRHRRVAAATARTVGARSEATAASPARGRLPHPRSPRGVARCSAPVWPSLRMTGRGSVVAPLGPSRRRPARPFPSRLLRTSGKKRSRRRRLSVQATGGLKGAPLHSSLLSAPSFLLTTPINVSAGFPLRGNVVGQFMYVNSYN